MRHWVNHKKYSLVKNINLSYDGFLFEDKTMSFLEAIKQGIANAENFSLNKQEALEIFEEANKAIQEKTKNENLCFVKFSDGRSVFPNGIVRSITHSTSNYYPLIIHTIDDEFECHNKSQLVNAISDILRSSAFGFYIKRFV